MSANLNEWITAKPLCNFRQRIVGRKLLQYGMYPGAPRPPEHCDHFATSQQPNLVTIFTCGLGSIWGLVDGILILVNGGTDAQGRVLRDS